MRIDNIDYLMFLDENMAFLYLEKTLLIVLDSGFEASQDIEILKSEMLGNEPDE